MSQEKNLVKPGGKELLKERLVEKKKSALRTTFFWIAEDYFHIHKDEIQKMTNSEQLALQNEICKKAKKRRIMSKLVILGCFFVFLCGWFFENVDIAAPVALWGLVSTFLFSCSYFVLCSKERYLRRGLISLGLSEEKMRHKNFLARV